MEPEGMQPTLAAVPDAEQPADLVQTEPGTGENEEETKGLAKS